MQSVIIGALYRPTNNSQPYMDSLNLVIEDVFTSNPGSAIWISGDINLPDIDWATDQVTCHQYPKALNESFLQLLARTGMEQLVDFPTRGDNTLDIIITNRPSLINRCEGMPGLSDHDIVYADWNENQSATRYTCGNGPTLMLFASRLDAGLKTLPLLILLHLQWKC